MEGIGLLGDDLPIMPERLFERLAQLPGYVWDETVCGSMYVVEDSEFANFKPARAIPLNL